MSHEKFLRETIQSFCDRIDALGMTRKEFCRLSGVSYETFKRLRNPTLHTFDKIDKALRKLEG